MGEPERVEQRLIHIDAAQKRVLLSEMLRQPGIGLDHHERAFLALVVALAGPQKEQKVPRNRASLSLKRALMP